jgi:hypothetical protein
MVQKDIPYFLRCSKRFHSFYFYEVMENIWGKEECTKCYIRSERKGIIWIKAGIWRLRGIRRGTYRGICPLYLGHEQCYTYTMELSRDKIMKNIIFMQIMARSE